MAYAAHVTDVATCPICLELFNSPKSLPCLHTFCLKCIEGHCRDNEPREEVACPVCTKKFLIPENGVTGLVSNLFLAGLVEARRTAGDVAIAMPCEVCLAENDQDGSTVAVSTMYCVDCHQKLCEWCCRPHKRMKPPHNVVPVGSEIEKQLLQTHCGKCDKHKNESVKLYCFDCKMNICFMCFAEEHKLHDSRNVERVADECVQQMDADLETIRKRADEARNEISRSDEERRRFIAVAEDVGQKITMTTEELKLLIDKQMIDMMLNVQSLKTEACKAVESHKENMEVRLTALETFISYCSELKAKGTPCDITRAANDLHIRATELMEIIPTDFNAQQVSFRPMNIHELLPVGQTLIGSVYLSDGNSDCTQALSMTRREMKLKKKLKVKDAAERNLNVELENDEKTVNSYEEQLQQLRESENELKAKLLKAERSVKELEKQRDDIRKSSNKFKSQLKNSEKVVKTLQTECEKLRTTESDAGMNAALDATGDALITAKKLEEQVELSLQLRKSECEAKAKLEKSENVVKSLNGQVKRLLKSENSLKAELKIATDKQKESEKQLKQTKTKRNETSQTSQS